MYQLAAGQETSTVNLLAFFLRLKTEKCALGVNKSEITGENPFNGDLVEIEGSHESSKDEKTRFYVFLQICYPCFNPQTVK